jgi:hypothetical protein
LDAGLTIADVAAHLECSPAKISRMETGVVGVRVQDLRDLVDLYQVGEVERTELYTQVRQARRKGWWHEFSDVCPPNSDTLFGLEDAARTIDQHSPSLVPGLLQTQGYATALIGSSGDSAGVCQRRLELRMRRQQLLKRSGSPRMEVLLDEGALYRQIGGAQVMAEQLSSLLSWFDSPNVLVRVVPLSAGAHPGVGVAFTVFTFSDALEESPVIYNEQLTQNAYIDEPAEVATFMAAWRGASRAALPLDRSYDLIEGCIRGLRTGATDSARLGIDADRVPVPRVRRTTTAREGVKALEFRAVDPATG